MDSILFEVKKMECPYCNGTGTEYIVDPYSGMDTDLECDFCQGVGEVVDDEE